MAKNKKTVAFIGAHADDIELGAGLAIQKFAKTHDILIIICSSQGKNRLKELKNSLNELIENCNIYILPLDENTIYEHIGTLAQYLDKIVPKNTEYIFTHNQHQTHQDHKAVSTATLTLARRIPNVLLWETVSPSEINLSSFNPQAFISGDMDKKIKAIQCHKSQVKRYSPQWIDAIKGLGALRAIQFDMYNGSGYLEAFEIVKTIIEE